MAFLKVGVAPSKEPRLYLIKFYFDDCKYPIFKIGKSSGKDSTERLMQVSKDHYNKYRYFPRASIKRDRKCVDAFKIEAMLHRAFKPCQFIPEKPFDGSHELFLVDEDTLVRSYEMALDGFDFDAHEPYNPGKYNDGLEMPTWAYLKDEIDKEIGRLSAT